MEELGVPNGLKSAVHNLYEQVKAKIRTLEGMPVCFSNDIGVKQGCPLSPMLFGLYIDKLEEWLNNDSSEGVQLANYVIKLLLYVDDLILIAKSAKGLREHLKTLETFCHEVGMQVNISKTKVMIFSWRRNKKIQVDFLFEGSPLEVVNEYKYLGLNFHNHLNWETCRAKRIQGGWKALYSLQNRCRNAELWDWKSKRMLFGLLVTPVILYGREIWGNSMSDQKWRQLERIQKHLIISSFKIKTVVPYEIVLAGTDTYPLEVLAMVRLVNYLKKIQNMENHRWPKLIMEERLDRRKNTWMKQNGKWMNKWAISIQECPNTNEEIKKIVKEKFSSRLWTKQDGCKKVYYIT